MRKLPDHGIDTGVLLEEAYAFCEETPGEEVLLAWAEATLRFARGLDQRTIPGGRRPILEELCALVDAHPASFSAAAAWAEARLEEDGEGHALLFLDALASAPERMAMDAAEEEAPSGDIDHLLASLPSEKVRLADEAVRGARQWKAKVHELFHRAEEVAATGSALRFAARADALLEEDYVLLCRFDEGELLLSRSEAMLWVDWYGAGEPRLTVEGEEIPSRPLPQGEGRRWPLPRRDPPYTLCLELEGSIHSIRVPAADEK